ncbi:MAG: peptide ABC transporter substrate-binding protein [Aphanocapsa lilacina HA4352-LM1]|nr:peptide ABC transporter substrate-binding protein [Aphanocapsa lilacina HA4352-LM1]
MIARVRRFWLVIAVALCLGGCSTHADEIYFGRVIPPERDILRVGNGAEPRSFDPHRSIAYAEGHIYLNIFEGLTCRDPLTLEARPALALRWRSERGARRWVFSLRRGARFSDGVPITAHDFVYSWRRLVDPQRASPYVFAAYPIQNARAIAEGRLPPGRLAVRALDDFTVQVDLEQPTLILPKLLSAWAFVALPSHVIERRGERWAKPEHLVASGPFRLAGHVPYDQIVLAKNPLYWDRDRVRLEAVYLLPVAEQAQNANLYRSGELDVVRNTYLPKPLIRALRRRKDFLAGTYFATRYFNFNLARPPFGDVRVRRALSLAIDREAIARKFLGGETPAYGVVPPIVPGYPAPRANRPDPEGARRLLAAAGFPGGRGFPRFTVSLLDYDSSGTLAQAVQQMWKRELGIDVDLQSEEAQTYQARAERRDFDVLAGGWIGDYVDPAAFLDLYLNDNPNNRSGWVDPEFSRRLDLAAAQADAPGRLKRLADAEAYLLEQVPVIPLSHANSEVLKKPWVQGWHPDPLGQHLFKYVWIDREWQRTAGRPPTRGL